MAERHSFRCARNRCEQNLWTGRRGRPCRKYRWLMWSRSRTTIIIIAHTVEEWSRAWALSHLRIALPWTEQRRLTKETVIKSTQNAGCHFAVWADRFSSFSSARLRHPALRMPSHFAIAERERMLRDHLRKMKIELKYANLRQTNCPGDDYKFMI